MKKYIQPEREMFLSNDRDVVVRYYLDSGEREWFDARAGVGSPGYDAYVCITEINLGSGFVSIEDSGLVDSEIEKLEDRLMTDLCEEDSLRNAERDEAEYDAWNNAMSLEELAREEIETRKAQREHVDSGKVAK